MIDWDTAIIDLKLLKKLQEKNEFSGFDRSDSVKIIRRLVVELIKVRLAEAKAMGYDHG
jgi:hypothetical protein